MRPSRVDGVSPLRALALRVLDRLFAPEVDQAAFRSDGAQPVADHATGVDLAAFQAEGVARLRAVLERRGGAILADSVGLGKTYMALALVDETLRAGGDAIVIVPAALCRQWRDALRALRGCQEDGEGGAGRSWTLLSHTRLARGAPVPPPARRRLVVVDEAHRFRNPATLRYAALARLLAAGGRVLFVTATPVNNSTSDLLHLLRLFAPDHAFRDLGVPSLRGSFEDGRTRAIVREVVVRRTRSMVRARFGPIPATARSYAPGATADARRLPSFPERVRPRVLPYRDDALPTLVRTVGDLELAAYAHGDRGSDAAAALLRLNLLKRLDSSAAAFTASLDRLERVHRAALDAAANGRLLEPRSTVGSRGNDGDPLQLILVNLVATPAPPDLDLDGYARSLRRDLDRIRRLRQARPDDPKLAALVDHLDGCRGEKVVVFTEYRDTAEAVWRALSRRFAVGRVDGGGAWLGRSPAGRRAVIERFAPGANGRPEPRPQERVDILIATDVLSEGLNLQDARRVVCQDLPWNPVRLLQRIGRLDRMGSPHREIVPSLFAPVAGLEEMLGLVRRLRTKLGHITGTVGAEQAETVLEELLSAHTSGTSVDPIVRAEAAIEPEDPLERLRSLWVRNRHRQGRMPESPDCGTVAVPADSPAAPIAAVLLVHAGATRTLVEVDRHGKLADAGAAATAVLEAALATEPSTGSQPPLLADQGAASGPRHTVPLREVHDHLMGRYARGQVPAATPRQDPGRRLARHVRRALAAPGVGLAPATVRRTDTLLSRLAAPLHPATAQAVDRLLERASELPPVALLDAAEAALAAAGADPVESALPEVVLEAAIWVKIKAPGRG